jgi:hypothetical protein
VLWADQFAKIPRSLSERNTACLKMIIPTEEEGRTIFNGSLISAPVNLCVHDVTLLGIPLRVTERKIQLKCGRFLPY